MMSRTPSQSRVKRSVQVASVTLWVSAALSIAPGAIAYAQSSPQQTTQDAPLPLETQQQLRALMDEGAKASAKNDWETAYRAIAKAWEIKQLPMIAASLAYIEINRSRYREAAEHLKYFLDNGPKDYPEQRADAEEKLAEARKHIASVEVTTNIEGARLFVDGNEVGRAPLATELYLEPGEHTFKVTHPGYQPAIQTAPLEAGETVAIPLLLKVEPPAPQPEFPTTPKVHDSPEDRDSGIQARTWALIGGSAATAISLGIGIGYTVRASSLGSDADSLLAHVDALPETTPPGSRCVHPTQAASAPCTELISLRDKQNTAANVSRAAYITAGVLGIATVATYLLWPSQAHNPSRSAALQLRVAPWSEGKAQGILVGTAF